MSGNPFEGHCPGALDLAELYVLRVKTRLEDALHEWRRGRQWISLPENYDKCIDGQLEDIVAEFEKLAEHAKEASEDQEEWPERRYG